MCVRVEIQRCVIDELASIYAGERPISAQSLAENDLRPDNTVDYDWFIFYSRLFYCFLTVTLTRNRRRGSRGRPSIIHNRYIITLVPFRVCVIMLTTNRTYVIIPHTRACTGCTATTRKSADCAYALECRTNKCGILVIVLPPTHMSTNNYCFSFLYTIENEIDGISLCNSVFSMITLEGEWVIIIMLSYLFSKDGVA